MLNQRNEVLTARLRAHDALMAASDLSPEEQVSVFIVLTILAVRRTFIKLGIHGLFHGRRRKLLRKAIEADFAFKLLTYTMPPPIDGKAEEPTMPEEPGALAGVGGS
jgi:hypothetical protein